MVGRLSKNDYSNIRSLLFNNVYTKTVPPRSVSREWGLFALWDCHHRVRHTLNSLCTRFHQNLEVCVFATTAEIFIQGGIKERIDINKNIQETATGDEEREHAPRITRYHFDPT